jgi:hypothetical protein
MVDISSIPCLSDPVNTIAANGHRSRVKCYFFIARSEDGVSVASLRVAEQKEIAQHSVVSLVVMRSTYRRTDGGQKCTTEIEDFPSFPDQVIFFNTTSS